MKEDIYQKYGFGDPAIEEREKAMEAAMPSAESILEKINAEQERIIRELPNCPAAKHPINVKLEALQAARGIWQQMRNPYIAIDDPSHPNNWTKYELLTMAGIIQSALGIPTERKITNTKPLKNKKPTANSALAEEFDKLFQ